MNKWISSSIFTILFAVLISSLFSTTSEKPMAIIIPSYNNEAYAKWNIESALNQNYTNYKIIYINDCSTDATSDIINCIIEASPKKDILTIIDNPTRSGALKNIFHSIYEHTDDDDIIVLLDGDDALAHSNVLSYLNKVYSDENNKVWLTYGQFQEKNSKNIGFCSPMPEKIVQNQDYRKWHHIPSHLRTFYSWLFKKIQIEDLKYNGEFYPMTWDMAMMLPMMEMCGPNFRFIKDVLYTYNDNNPISDHRVSKTLQKDLDIYIRTLPKYPVLTSLPQIISKTEPPSTGFSIVIASYNNTSYCIDNIKSALEQKYSDFHIYFIDDCSQDDTFTKVQRYVQQTNNTHRVTFIQNAERRGAAYNYYTTIHRFVPPNNVVVILDGDDELANKHVLSYLDRIYRKSNKDVWLTYGQYMEKNSHVLGFCRDYPYHINAKNAYRKWQNIPSHLKTFRCWLFNNLKKENFMYDGKFLEMTWDMAAMIPMMELCGPNHYQFISKILYIYNDRNPISDHQVSMELQRYLDKYVRALPPYSPLKK
ncbi:MAG: glycosyltransferase family 2 protein [Chlamydiales bacterium]|nr:glycosyltransferase family 2 protein [Chlamydiales bacterium]